MAQVTQIESQEDEDFRMTDAYIMGSEKYQVTELIHLAQIDRDALDASKALAAAEKAMYESRIASIETLHDTEVEWGNTLKRNHHEKDRVILAILTAHLPVDKAAETVALFKSKDEQLNAQGRFIDAYRTQYKCGLRQMAEMVDMYRNSLTDQADDHRTEITDLYDRVTKLVAEVLCLKDKLKRAEARPAARCAKNAAKAAAKSLSQEATANGSMRAYSAEARFLSHADLQVAISAALSDKDAEIARLNKAAMTSATTIENLTAAKDAEKGASLMMVKIMLDKDNKAAAVIAAKDAEISRLTEELAAARGLAAMET